MFSKTAIYIVLAFTAIMVCLPSRFQIIVLIILQGSGLVISNSVDMWRKNRSLPTSALRDKSLNIPLRRYPMMAPLAKAT